MIKFENTQVFGWDAAIRGMRNPLESHRNGDTLFFLRFETSYASNKAHMLENGEKYIYGGCYDGVEYWIGPNDADLMMRLRKAGTDHRKFMRMITVYVDITAPRYWATEMDTYKVGTVKNSCSTMHKIHAKEFTFEDFSHERLDRDNYIRLGETIACLNTYRNIYNNGGVIEYSNGDMVDYYPGDRVIWWQMIQMLPQSYNQKATYMLNYEVLANIYKSRKYHKLDEWRIGFMEWIRGLPFSELITGE